MNDPLRLRARYLAYCRYRLTRPSASHQEAWKYSGRHWDDFVFEALETSRERYQPGRFTRGVQPREAARGRA